MTDYTFRNWSMWAEWRGGMSYLEVARRHEVSYSAAYIQINKIERRLRHPVLAQLLTHD